MKKKGLVYLATALIPLVVLSVGAVNDRPASPPVEGQSTQSANLAEKQFAEAVVHLKRENFSEAIAAYEKVVALSPDTPIALDAKYWIGQSYFRMGKYDEALTTFRELLKDHPGSAIIPVTELMVLRVEQEKESCKLMAQREVALDQKVIVDPETGVEFRKVRVFAGKSDVIENVSLTLSPNGRFLLYENTVIPMNGEEPFELVEGALRTAWSPDGRKVAYFREDAIWVIPVSPETGRPVGPGKKLLDGRYRFQEPVSWSPDSEKMAFMRLDDKNRGDIWILSLKNGDLTQATDDPKIEAMANWSPDGKTIAYVKMGSGIWAVDADGENPRKLFDAQRGSPHWSPDGQWILLASKGLHFFHLSDKRIIDIAYPEGVGEFFSWSADGKKLLFYRPSYDFTVTLRVVSSMGGPTFRLGRTLDLRPYGQFWARKSHSIITVGPENIWNIPLTGGEAAPVALNLPVGGASGAPNKLLSLSPDAKRILFSVDRKDGNKDLYVAPFSPEEARATEPAVEIIKGWDDPGFYSNYSWSTDGRKLTFIHQGNLWITSAVKISPVRITDTPETEILPVMSPDGQRIAYIAQNETFKFVLKVVAASGGEPEAILEPGARWAYTWSPDSKKLIALSNTVISVISFPGGKSREILDFEREGLFLGRGFCWLPDGKHFAFISQKGREAPCRIYVVPAEGGQIIEIATDDDGWKDFLFPSPDGKWISYNSEGWVKTRPEGSIWEVRVEDLLKGKR